MPPRKKRTTGRRSPSPPLPRPDRERALRTVMELMAIDGPSTREGRVIAYLMDHLRRAGYRKKDMELDRTPEKSPLGGETGGLILTLPGTRPGPRRLLMAHVDTVPLCVGARPVIRGGYVVSADRHTALGADDRAGAAVLLLTALALKEHRLPHPPLTFYWPVQEEVGLFGARYVSLSQLGRPKLAFNWDGGDPAKLTIGATGAYRLEIEVRGRASHAGGAPEQGVSATAIAALAIADLHRGGWHGLIEKNGQLGTSNVGVIQGGQATNVVTDRVLVRAEARSHDPRFRQQIVEQFRQAFQRAAQEVQSVDGHRGRVRFRQRLDYDSFVLDPKEPCVQAAEAAVRRSGGKPQHAVANGGLDANWLVAKGLPTVSLGCGQLHQHTTAERLRIRWFLQACQIALLLACGAEAEEP